MSRPLLVKPLLALAAFAGATVALPALPGATETAPARAIDAVPRVLHRAVARHGGHCGDRGADPRTCTVTASEAVFRVAPITAADGARLVRTGSTTIRVKVGGPGTISAVGSVPVGTVKISVEGTAPDGSSRRIPVAKDYERATEPASVTTTHAGTARLTVTLTAAAKARLAHGAHADMTLAIRSTSSPISLATFVPLTLGAARRSTGPDRARASR
jgi:hypothetical protein